MVRACNPPARDPARSWFRRRSTIATSTPANASSPANIRPVGPPPAITTACVSMILLLWFLWRFWFPLAIMGHGPGLAASPPVDYKLEVGGVRFSTFPHLPAVDSQQSQLQSGPRACRVVVGQRDASTQFGAIRHPSRGIGCYRILSFEDDDRFVYYFELVVYLRRINSCTTALARRPPVLMRALEKTRPGPRLLGG